MYIPTYISFLHDVEKLQLNLFLFFLWRNYFLQNVIYFTSKDDIHKYLLAYFFTHEKTLEINFSSLLIENGEITILHINCSLLGNEHESYPISPTATFFQMTFSYLQIKMIWIWNWIHIRYIYYILYLHCSKAETAKMKSEKKVNFIRHITNPDDSISVC